MKSEDLLKIIGDIDEKFIEEASVQINTDTKTNSPQESENSKIIKVTDVKPRNTIKIVASIAACLCLAVSVCFVIVGLSKVPSSSQAAASGGKAEIQEKSGDSSEVMDGDPSGYFDNSGNPLFGSESGDSSEAMYGDPSGYFDNSGNPLFESEGESSSSEVSESPSFESDGETSSSESSDTHTGGMGTEYPIDEMIIESPRLKSSDVKEIKAGMTYSEIIDKLGQGANFCQAGLCQYIVDDEYVLVLHFDNITDVCTKSGEELMQEAVPYKVPERLSDKAKDNPIYGIVTDYKFISCINNNPSICYNLNLSDAEIKFENGKPATVDDIKLMSGVIVIFDTVAETYPGQLHCTSVTIIDSIS